MSGSHFGALPVSTGDMGLKLSDRVITATDIAFNSVKAKK